MVQLSLIWITNAPTQLAFKQHGQYTQYPSEVDA